MESVDGEKSVKLSSEEGFPLECSPCEYGGITKEAKYYCSECSEFLCESCETTHRRLKSTRNHRVSASSEVTLKEAAIQGSSIAQLMCSCNHKEVTVYCEVHHDIICFDCKTLNHRTCKASSLDEKCKSFDVVTIDETVRNMNELSDKIRALKMQRENDLKGLKELANDCREKVRVLRKELDSELDKMEENTLNELDEYEKREKETISQHIEACSTGLKTLESKCNSLLESKEHIDRVCKFTYNLQLCNLIKKMTTVLKDITTEVLEPKITFDPYVSVIRTDILKLGDVKCTSRDVPLADMSIAPFNHLDIKLPSDKNTPWITDSVFLPTCELILCDRANQNIKLFDGHLSLKEHISLNGKPWSISLFDATNVIITRPDCKVLHFIEVLPKLQSKRTIQLDKVCFGVATNLNSIYVAFRDGEVRELDQTGTNMRTICKIPIVGSFYLSISTHGKLYVGTDVKNEVWCLLLDGTQIFKYSDPSLNTSLGMYVDSNENVLVCGQLSNNVHLTDKEGNKIKVILSEKDGVSWPYTVSFRPSDNILVVGCYGQDKLKVFKLQ